MLNANALYTVTGGDVHVLVIAPGTVNAAVLDRGAIIVQLEFFDQSLDLLGLGARRDQHGVGGRHHDDVVEPDHGGEHRFIRAHEAVAAIHHHDRPIRRIAGGVVIEHIPDRVPVSDVGPAKVGRHNGHELGALHHRTATRIYTLSPQALLRR